MDNKERKRFWDVLCSADGKDVNSDSKKIAETITCPRFLYRYRPISLSSIDALQRNMLYFSKANYYDDPFDTIIKIDFGELFRFAENFFQSEDIPKGLEDFSMSLGIKMTDVDNAKAILQKYTPSEIAKTIVDYTKNNYQSVLKKELWSVCFAESGINETMWLKYAQQYEGFCVVYDLDDSTKRMCGKKEKCRECIVNLTGTTLYPIYYTDDGYDATDYLKNIIVRDIAGKYLAPCVAAMLRQVFPEMPWEQERITLNKSKCHEYDQEWRMLLRGKTKDTVVAEWIPYGVIIGLRMSERDRDIVVRSAKMAGIEHLFELYISDETRLDMREVDIVK